MKTIHFFGVLCTIVVLSSFTMTTNQVMPTSLRITVLNKLGNAVENAKVTLYVNEEDYEKEQNAVGGPSFTDEKGRVTFKTLDAIQYYVQVVKGEESNYGQGEKTDKLEKGKLNKINIIIE